MFLHLFCLITRNGGKQRHCFSRNVPGRLEASRRADSKYLPALRAALFFYQHSQPFPQVNPNLACGYLICPFLVWLFTFQQLSWLFKIEGWKGAEEKRDRKKPRGIIPETVCVSPPHLAPSV